MALRQIREGQIDELLLELPDLHFIDAMVWLSHAYSENEPNQIRFGMKGSTDSVPALLLKLGGHGPKPPTTELCQLQIWDVRQDRVTPFWASLRQQDMAEGMLFFSAKPDALCPVPRMDAIPRCAADVLVAGDHYPLSSVQSALLASSYDKTPVIVAARRDERLQPCEWIRRGNAYARELSDRPATPQAPAPSRRR